MLEPYVRPEALEQCVTLTEVRHGVCTREDSELDDLRAKDRRSDEREHRVDLPLPAEDVDGAACEDKHAGDSQQQEDRARQKVEPAWAVEKHEANVSPCI